MIETIAVLVSLGLALFFSWKVFKDICRRMGDE